MIGTFFEVFIYVTAGFCWSLSVCWLIDKAADSNSRFYLTAAGLLLIFGISLVVTVMSFEDNNEPSCEQVIK